MTDMTLTDVEQQTDVCESVPLLTIFTVLKPFEGEADRHQRNALASWKALGQDVEVILFSDSSIPDDINAQFRCLPCIATNDFGTPLLSEVFRVAADIGRGSLRAFVNADIVLDQRFLTVAKRLSESPLASWLAIGQRVEMDFPADLSHKHPDWIGDCFGKLRTHGTPASIVCKDYFLFTGNLYTDIPAFAIGRGNWDNWMVSHSKSTGVPVVDIGAIAPVIHQRHGYGHVKGGRMSVYVRGPEAKENQRLAGGRNLIGGSTANWKLSDNGVRKIRVTAWSFGKDLLRFARLMGRMLLGRD